MRFIKKDDYYVESQCKHYRIAKYDGARYLCWRKTERRWEMGECFDDYQAAVSWVRCWE